MKKESELHHTTYPLTGFLNMLKRRGFVVGTDTHIHIHFLLQQFDLPDELDTVAGYLCPLVAQDKEQQHEFRALFNQMFGTQTIEKNAKMPETKSTEKPKTGKTQEQSHTQRRKTVSERWRQTDEKKIVVNIDSGTLPAQGLSFSLEPQNLDFPFSIVKAFRQMRFMHDIQHADFDIEQTIHATLCNGGFATPVYKARRQHVEYLFIVQQDTHRSLMAQFIRQVYKTMRENNLNAVMYTYRTDPRVLYNPRHKNGILLTQVHALHAGSVLLFFGHAAIW